MSRLPPSPVGTRRFQRAGAAAIEFALDSVVTTDPSGRVTEFNPAAEQLFGFSREEALGRDISELIAPAPLKVVGKRVKLVARRRDGVELPVELTVTRTGESPPGYIAFVRDLSQERVAGRADRGDGDRYRRIVERSAEGIWTIDLGLRTTLVNPAMASMLGYEPDDMLGSTVSDFMEEAEAGLVRDQLASRPGAAPAEMEGWLRHRDGSDVWVLLRVSAFRDADGGCVGGLAMVTDMSQRRRGSRRHALLTAMMDASDDAILVSSTRGEITGWNLAAERLYGYSAEDAIGARVTDLITPPERSGEHDEMFNRIASGRTMDRYETERRRKDGTRIRVSLTSYPIRDAGDRLTGMAVAAREVAQRMDHEERVRRELDGVSWVGRIRNALEDDRFVLWGQPIIDLETGDTVQEELLIRMVEPDGEIVPPGHFLPAAEQYGLIGDIDRWVLQEAVKLSGRGHSVQVNISAHSVGRPEVFSAIEHELNASRAQPERLVVEITETALIGNLDAGSDFARRLSRLGCQFALDDFGTGFGSFTYLKELPVDYLKVDLDFVRELTSDPANQHVVRAVVSLAKGFGIKSIAEGVEDEETLDMLRDFGVDYAQGYHLGRPAPLGAERSAAPAGRL